MSFRIINADVMNGLAQLEDESVHCVVTSPPYWGLRDYGVAGQIGLEPTPDAFVARMVEVFREVRRVLRKDGTCWVNLGDVYNSQNGFHRGKPYMNGGAPKTTIYPDRGGSGLKPKDLIGMPWRVAFALQSDGWWLRSDIIWSKPNPMPESVTDRPTKSHEYVFLLSKSATYFYDAEAIKEQESAASTARYAYAKDGRINGAGAYADAANGQGAGTFAAANAARTKNPHIPQDGKRNKRSVWTIATAPFPEAHFATFPPELPEICIKAGCPVGGTVLDPFAGAGTTLLVADRLQRNAIGIELNPEYAAMAERRLANDRGRLLDFIEQPKPAKQLSLLDVE
jgi:DNA modification methylase